MNPINVTGYDREKAISAGMDALARQFRGEFVTYAEIGLIEEMKDVINQSGHQRPGGHRKMKIHYVTAVAANVENDKVFLVKAHTRAGAERFVRNKLQPVVTATVATQDELVAAMQAGVKIEDATSDPQASIPEPDQTQE